MIPQLGVPHTCISPPDGPWLRRVVWLFDASFDGGPPGRNIAMDGEIWDRHTRSYQLHARRCRHPGGRRICRRHSLEYRPDLLLSRCNHQQARTETLDREGAQHGQTSQHPCRSAEMRDEFHKDLGAGVDTNRSGKVHAAHSTARLLYNGRLHHPRRGDRQPSAPGGDLGLAIEARRC